jgi:ABC-type glycerol-3-phosphate transport system substrate-binding protein
MKFDYTTIENVEPFLQPKAATGMMPDFTSINGNSFGADLVDGGILIDVSNTEAAKNTVNAVKPQFVSPSGKLFGIAGGVSSSLIYYQKKAFTDLGITPSDNWEDLLHTPVGSVYATYRRESGYGTSWWQIDYYVKKPEDYTVLGFFLLDGFYVTKRSKCGG